MILRFVFQTNVENRIWLADGLQVHVWFAQGPYFYYKMVAYLGCSPPLFPCYITQTSHRYWSHCIVRSRTKGHGVCLFVFFWYMNQTKANSSAHSPQANYTDWATATCRRNLEPTFADRGVSLGQRGGSPTVVNRSFLDRSRYFLLQVAPHLCSRGWVSPVSDPQLIRKSDSTGNRTRDLCICNQELWPLDNRGGPLYMNNYNHFYFENLNQKWPCIFFWSRGSYGVIYRGEWSTKVGALYHLPSFEPFRAWKNGERCI
jgi:hypothetical protein